MNDSDHTDELTIKSASVPEHQQVFYPRGMPNYMRPRLSFPRRRGMPVPGRYLNCGFRPVSGPLLRPGFPMQALPPGYRPALPSNYYRYFCPPGAFNPAFTNTPPCFYHKPPMQRQTSPRLMPRQAYEVIESDELVGIRPPGFYHEPPPQQQTPPRSKLSQECKTRESDELVGSTPPSFHHKPPIQLPRSPRSKLNPDREKKESSESVSGPQLNQGSVWVEVLGPSGEMYNCDANTRETSWKTPANATIIDLDQGQTDSANMGPLPPMRGYKSFARRLPSFDGSRAFYPAQADVGVPRGFTLLPPSPTARSLSQVAAHSSDLTPSKTDEKTAAILPSFAAAGTSTLRKDIGIETNETSRVKSNALSAAPAHLRAWNERTYSFSESRITDWSKTDSKTSLDTPNSRKSSATTIVKPSSVAPNECKSPQEGKRAVVTSDSPTKQTSFAKKQPENKSRPVSSTPVAGTCWCVVWTGDERVFFYDTERKMSVWERPDELLERLDVDKFVAKPVSLQQKKTKFRPGGSESRAKETKTNSKQEIDSKSSINEV